MDRAALAEAERLYGEALTGEAPDSARVAERVALGIGRVAVCLSQAGVVDRWDDAERELTAVTSAYERDVTGVRELASEAHALLAVVSLPEASAPDTQGRLWDAEEHARQAVELAVQPGRRGVHLGQLGSSLARLGRTTEARDAYLEAAELDPQRAETYRARAAEMDGG